jgi:hypothetical protein
MPAEFTSVNIEEPNIVGSIMQLLMNIVMIILTEKAKDLNRSSLELFFEFDEYITNKDTNNERWRHRRSFLNAGFHKEYK